MKKILVLADMGWSIERVHRDVAAELGDHYEFTFRNAASFEFETVFNEFQASDLCLTTLAIHDGIIETFNLTQEHDLRKLVTVAHGFGEILKKDTWSKFITYGAVSDVLVPFFPVLTHVVPNGVSPSFFERKELTGKVKLLGWCGAMYIPVKRAGWPTEIARKSHLAISIAEKLTFEDVQKWYHTIDILLVTSGPEPHVETGPLPPFEAVLSGVPVIGTKVGNFRKMPGPKFSTTDEAAVILEELKSDPERVKNLAAEQYTWVMEHWTYETHAAAWKQMFDAAIEKQKKTALVNM